MTQALKTDDLMAPSPLPPTPPPPPPMPHESRASDLSLLSIDLVDTNNMKPSMKMRTLNWRRIPKKKVLCQQVNKTLDNIKSTPTTATTSSNSSTTTSSQNPTFVGLGSSRRQTCHPAVCKTQLGGDHSYYHTTAATNQPAISEGDNEDDKNIWFLIARENKCLREQPAPSLSTSTLSCSSPSSSSSSSALPANSSKSASRIREMLESVRRRMAAVTANQSSSSSVDHYQLLNNSYSRHLQTPPTSANTSLASTLVATSAEAKRATRNILEVIDFDDLESLFCLNSQPAGDRANESFAGGDSESPNFVRRSSMRTNASSDSVISSSSYGGDDDDLSLETTEMVNILNSKKSLNVNIFLKQLKSADELIEQINRDEHSQIGKEKLDNLLKLLPDSSEEGQLMKFHLRSRQHRLPVAERFLLQLMTDVPNVRLRIKFLLLQEEYRTDLELISPELDKIERAVKEIRASKMLRDLLSLVLVTGNFLNAGGYAADAAGFSLDSLERLGEVRSNKVGVNLIHYVANVANKLQLIDFQQKELPSIEAASRVCVDSIKLDLGAMMAKIVELKRDTEKEAEEDNESPVTSSADPRNDEGACSTSSSSDNKAANQLYLLNLLRTLDDIKSNVEFLRQRVTLNLERTRRELADYLCEDQSTFKLHECFHHIMGFNQRLKTAHEENGRRQRIQEKSFSSSLRRSNTINSRLQNGAGRRQSLGNMNLKQPPIFSYLPTTGSSTSINVNAAAASNRRASLADSMAVPKAATLTRTTSTFNMSPEAYRDRDHDDLHEGLMKLLISSKNRRASGDCQNGGAGGSRYKSSNAFGAYRRKC